MIKPVVRGVVSSVGIGIHRRSGGVDPNAAVLALLNDGHTVNFSDFTIESSITKDGSARVSEVTPIIGDAANALKQAGADNIKPVWDAEGLTLDGVRQFMATDNITLDHPGWVYVVFKQLSWTLYDVIIDGNNRDYFSVWQRGSSPLLAGYVGGALGDSAGMNVNTWGIIRLSHSDILNGYWSYFIVNNNTQCFSYLGDRGAPNGITLGRSGGFDGNYSNIKVKAILRRNKRDTIFESHQIYNYLNSRFNIGLPQASAPTISPFDNGKLILTFDDSSGNHYSEGLTHLLSLGVTATFYEITGLIGTAGICTWAQLVEMHQAGMDIQCHSIDGNWLVGTAIATIQSSMDTVKTAFATNGLPTPLHHAYPTGSYDQNVITALTGRRLTGRTYRPYDEYTPVHKATPKFEIDAMQCDAAVWPTWNADFKQLMDDAKENKTAVIFVAHTYYSALVEDIVDYAQALGLDIINMSQLYELMDLDANHWDTRTPTNLFATVYRDTEADLTWTDPSGGDTKFRIYKSTDGINYTAIGTTAIGDNTYTATGLTAGVVYYFYVVGYLGVNESPASNIWDTYFKITVDTTKAGSGADTFVLPVTAKGAGDYYVTWGDGSAEETFNSTGNKSHTYAAQGSYQVKVRGGMTAISFNNAGDKLKLTTVDQWGNLKWSSCLSMFYGCANMTGTYLDNPNTVSVITMRLMFFGCTLFNSQLSYMNTSEVTTFQDLFGNCTNFNQSLSTWNSAKVTITNGMFYNAAAFKQSLATFSLAQITAMANTLLGANINAVGTSTNYDNTLIAWAAADVPNSIAFHGGSSKYGEGLVDNGTTTSASAGKLIQSGQNFVTTVTIGDVVYNTTDQTYALVTAIDSDTQLSISADIMASGEVYRIQHGAGAKARASLIIDDLWTIIDGGYL